MAASPLILFGAFDRHNLGDLLFAHLAAACVQGREIVFAGLAERDLTALGGHRVQAIAALARDWGRARADVLHVGGEILTCDLYEAAIMLLPPAEAGPAIARYDRHAQLRLAWARARLGLDQTVAYMVPKALFARPGRFAYHAVGGVDLTHKSPALRADVRARLREADAVSVRDRVTAGQLAAMGIAAGLAPDLAELVAVCFGERIQEHAGAGEVAAVRARFPQGYLAVQCAGEYADDATLMALAAQLDEVAGLCGLGLVLFRAGAAPWHDDLAVYRRLQGLLPAGAACLFASLNVWDICALLAQARAYYGSSLHGGIIAAAFGVPALPLRLPGQRGRMAKSAAYRATWHKEAMPEPERLAQHLQDCLRQDRALRLGAAQARAQRALEAMRATLARLGV